MVRCKRVSESLKKFFHFDPGSVSVDGVSRDANDFRFVFLEIFDVVVHIDEFRRADKGEIRRIEEKHEPFALKVIRRDFFDFLTRGIIRFEREMGKLFIYLEHVFHYNGEMARRKSRFRSRFRFILYIAIFGALAWLGFKYYDPIKTYLMPAKTLQVAEPKETASPEVSGEKLAGELSALVKALPPDLGVQSTAAPEVTERLDLNGDGLEEIIADLNDSGAYTISYGVFEFRGGKWKFLDLILADGTTRPAIFQDGASVRNAEVFKVLEGEKALAQVSGLGDDEGNWSWEVQAFSWNSSKYVYDASLSAKIKYEQPKKIINGQPMF